MSLNALLANHQDVGQSLVPDYIKDAPKEVRTRIAALKKLQLKTVDIQADFYRRVHELETQFRARYDEVNKQREAIINGSYEPGENEADAKIFSWMEDEEVKKFNDEVVTSEGDKPKGIPNFWLNVFRNAADISELITEQDEAVLSHLTDITIDQTNEPEAFTLKFHFSVNPYFTNSVLTKHYKLSIGPNGYEETVLYEGPSIVATKGCQIDWKDGMDVTKKTIKKKPKKGGKATVKVVPNDSFFRFFTPEVEEITKDLPEESADILNSDFAVGQLIRDSVVDSAILYYTGENADEDEFGDFGGGEDEDGIDGDADTDDE